MSDAQQDFSRAGVFKSFILPAALVFLIPVASLLFFRHARDRLDAQALGSIQQETEADETLTPEQRKALLEHFTAHPFSELIQEEPVASRADPTIRFYYATFRWMILLSIASIVASVAVFALAALCLLLSRRSQRAQYLSLAAGWQILRAFGAFQVIVQGAMVVALSFWVTALWLHVYSLKLIVVAGLLAIGGAFAVLKAIFHRPSDKFHVEGKALDPAGSPRLWQDLQAICDKVGTRKPDNIVVGVDDNFFVTEAPVHVDGAILRGRTLFVSLGLLKQMAGAEADAVLAHEMAHFSGEDTLYSRKTAPLLARLDNYLAAMSANPVALPAFAFLRGFRALFELARGEQSRAREFRADRIAAETTSPRDLASALMRVTAYSDFRSKIQQDLFGQRRALEVADVSARLEAGFHEYARGFASRPELEQLSTSHPFDSHPSMAGRLAALGVPLQSEDVPAMLAAPGDGRWYDAIDDAEEIERGMWERFEQAFRELHERTLPYRLLPATDEEREIVERTFPEIAFEGKKGTLTIRCDSIRFADWPTPIGFSEVLGISLNGHDLVISYNRQGAKTTSIPAKSFGLREAEAIQAIGAYYGRYVTAASHGDAETEETEPDAA
jgi:Zn-dependent protease with chaperone function